MKKISLLFITIQFITIYNLAAQNKDEIRTEIYKKIKDKTVLKEFDSNITPNGEIKNSLVLSKNSIYGWYTYLQEPNQLQISLHDSNETFLFQNKTNETGIMGFITQCDKTGVYQLEVKNLTNKEISNIVVLTYEGKIEAKNSDSMIPLTENKECVKDSNNEPSDKNDVYFFVVEEMPKFNGKNSEEFKKFIINELKYPQEAIDKKFEGNVFVQFAVSTDGYVKEAKVVRGIHPALDQEALRIIYSSPRWEPGKQRGQAVNVVFTFPVEFKLP